MNTISTKTYRDKYRLSVLDKLLRKALIAEKICEVDHSDAKTIQNPYGSQPTTVVQAIAGTYTVAAYTTYNDELSVDDEFIVAEHIYDFENTLSSFDLFANRTDEQMFSVASAIDTWVLNTLLEAADTTTYTTPAGGFTTAANIPVIMSNLISKVAGYADVYKGLYLVVENTDIVGLIQSQATQGFSMADAALNNGFMNSYMGVDIYVIRTGTFQDASPGTVAGTKTWTNSGHRLFGVKGMSTYAAPRNVQFDELMVTTKTGKEVRTYGYVGFKAWATKLALTVDITLA